MEFTFSRIFAIGVIGTGLISCGALRANDVYIAQNATGSANGSSCANSYAVTFVNTAANWTSGSPSGTQIGPGTTVHLCGTITTEISAHGSGSAAAPITILFETGAQISLPACDNANGCVNVSGLSYLIVDGGSPCGPGTACSQSLIGTGKIQETSNGSGLTNQQSSIAINAQSGCQNCEFRNLIIGPLYQHTSASDTMNFGADGAVYVGGCNGCTIKIHDSTMHDLTAGINYVPTANDNGLQFYNNVVYNFNGAINLAGSSASNQVTGSQIHDNYLHDAANWDANGCPYHHDGIHAWGTGGGTISGVSFYNNLVSGNFGGCPTGAVFFEGSNSASYLYNNVFGTTYIQQNNPIVSINGTNLTFVNNTIVGAFQPGDSCFGIGYSSDSSSPYTPSISFENNIITGCHTLVVVGQSPTLLAWDYNTYGGNNSSPWYVQPSTGLQAWYTALSSWESSCSCDIHSSFQASQTYVGLAANLSPQTGSPAIGAGANLTGLGMSLLNMDTSDGGQRTPMPRLSSGSWTEGAFNAPASGNGPPAPPSGLTVVTN